MNINKIMSNNSARYTPLKGEQGPENSSPPHGSPSHRIWKLAVLFLGMVNVFLMGFIVSQWSNIRMFSSEFNHLSNSPIPKLPIRPYEFADDDRFRNLDTLAKVESAWDAIFPQGNGFIHLANPESYNLSPNEGVPINGVLHSRPNAYIISAFHQVHCLMLLHRFHVRMLTKHLEDDQDNSTTCTEGAKREKRPLLTDDETNHAEHCFIYLRQGVLCSGDTTLEQPDNDGLHVGHNPLHGWGTEHLCRDWDVLGAWAEENAAF